MTRSDYQTWLETIAECVQSDALWRIEAYRLALFLAHSAMTDSGVLLRSPALRLIGPQLALSVGAIGANIAEGFGRGGSRDRARFYEYAPGSAREARVWHLQASPVLGTPLVQSRLDDLTSVIRLLTVAVRGARIDPPRGGSR